MPLNFNSDDLKAIESPPPRTSHHCQTVSTVHRSFRLPMSRNLCRWSDYECVNIQFKVAKGEHENRRCSNVISTATTTHRWLLIGKKGSRLSGLHKAEKAI